MLHHNGMDHFLLMLNFHLLTIEDNDGYSIPYLTAKNNL